MTEAWKQWEGQSVRGAFDTYELGQPLGQSENSAVFLTGRGAQKNQKAAIKFIPADEAGAEACLSRWKLAEKLSHPHLVRIFDMGRCRLGDADLVFVVTEFADEDLSQILPERPLTEAETRDMLRPALDALLYVHRQGFIHGHIKPANIMAVNNQVKLSSDGLYRADEPPYLAGKPGVYDAPEVNGGPISPAADVWSLGMTLTEVLTQRLPVRDATAAADPAAPSTLPAPFLEIVRQCLRRDPQARCKVPEIAARLQTPEPVRQPPAPPAPAKRSFIVPLVAAVVVVAIAGGWRLMQSHSGDRENNDRQNTAAALPEKKAAPPQSPAATKSARNQKPAPVIARPSPAHAEPQTRVTAPPPPVPEKPATGDAGSNGVVREVIPKVSQRAMDTIRGKIRVSVRVKVDGAGNVTDAELESPGSSRYFARLSMEAAQGWKFVPAQSNEERATRSWRLQFEFTNTEIRAIPERTAAIS